MGGHYHWYDPAPGHQLAMEQALGAGSTQIIREITDDTDVAPGDEVWVRASSGQAITLTILHEPAGEHCRIKRLDGTDGVVTAVPQSGTIDGDASFTIAVKAAYEFDSNGTDFAVF